MPTFPLPCADAVLVNNTLTVIIQMTVSNRGSVLLFIAVVFDEVNGFLFDIEIPYFSGSFKLLEIHEKNPALCRVLGVNVCSQLRRRRDICNLSYLKHAKRDIQASCIQNAVQSDCWQELLRRIARNWPGQQIQEVAA